MASNIDFVTRRALSGLLVGLAITAPAILIALISGGAGHGDYALTRALFPLPMLLTRLTNDIITIPSIILALIQFPIYGTVIGYGSAIGDNAKACAILSLLSLHAIAAVLCFAGVLPNFS